jgi:hypothetical protein
MSLNPLQQIALSAVGAGQLRAFFKELFVLREMVPASAAADVSDHQKT